MGIIVSPAISIEKSLEEQRKEEKESKVVSFRVPSELEKMLTEIELKSGSNRSSLFRKWIVQEFSNLQITKKNEQISSVQESKSKGEQISEAFMWQLLNNHTGTGWAEY